MSGKLLFIHDHKFFKTKDGCYYSEGKLPSSAFERFLNIADSITVLCRSKDTNDADGLVISSSDSVGFSPVTGRTWLSIWGRYFFSNIRHVIALIDEADIVAIRLPCIFSLFVFPILMIKRKPYAVEVVGDAFEAIYNSGGRRASYKFLGWFFDFYTKIIVSRAVGAIYVTRYKLQEKYKGGEMVSYASNVSIGRVCESVISDRENHIRSMVKNEKFKVGVIGSFSNNYKGIDVLIEAVSICRKSSLLDIDLHVLGSGEVTVLKPAIEKFSAQNWIFFDGRKKSEEVALWLDALDLYCQPSRTEGLPRALIEAMSRGCPAIATTVGGIPELLPESRLVESGDSAALAAKISELLIEPDLMVADSYKNFEVAKQYYSDALEERRKQFWEGVAISCGS
ncbi:glycosyltransferase [Alcanivorax sp. DG881]|uniref:glycosyltransferase n=1 Tax=Alcanivorax sp. DG881 TaxID=236097 RepID=UPI00017EDA4E|nr:glycosyltransferase [Alcanivorax sp. DG881]EDX90558.1 glycosyl transferase, group 1 family protein [Alcanivorax sp. DG881]